jgi:hypothetical protein
VAEAEWDVVCPGCPGNDNHVSAVPSSPPLTCREQAELVAEFHDELYSDLGDRTLR